MRRARDGEETENALDAAAGKDRVTERESLDNIFQSITLDDWTRQQVID
jgi:hypothetical protein